jgi:hypothetical protein
MTRMLNVPDSIITEIEWQLKVSHFAEQAGWVWFHVPRSRVGKVWLTRARGPLAKGWPDLLLIRGPRIIGAELKTEKGQMRPDQERVGDLLRTAMEVYTWRPSDWPEVQRILNG